MIAGLAPEGRARRLLPTILGGSAIVLVGLIRVPVLAAAAPSGIDGGNWLAFGDFTRAGSWYPPLIPVAFARLAALLGPGAASTIAATAASVLPALAVFGVGRWAGRSLSALLAGLVVAASGAVGEAAAWGGYPQLVGIAETVVALTALAAFLSAGGRRAALVYAMAFAATVATSHIVAVPAAAAAGLLALAELRTAPARSAMALVIAAVPFAFLAATYAALFATLGLPSAGGRPDAAAILGPAWIADVLLLGATLPLTIAMRLRRGHLPEGPERRRDRALLSAAAAAAGVWAVAYLASGEPRVLYDVATLAPLCGLALMPTLTTLVATRPARADAATRLVARPRAARALVAVPLVAVCTLLAASGLASFPEQVDTYRVLTPGDLAAMQWLAMRPGLTAGEVLVADHHGVPLGWWAEGITDQPALYASELRWLRFSSERERALVANTLLYRSGFPDPDSAVAIAAAGVRYVLLPDPAAFGLPEAGASPGWRVAYAEGGAVVLMPDPLASAGK